MISSFQPPLKRHKYLNFEESKAILPDENENVTHVEPSKFDIIRSMCSQKPQNVPLSKGPIRTWEERRSFAYFSSINQKGLFDLSSDDVKRIEITIPNLIQNPQIDDVKISNALQFTAIGLESVLYPHWSDENTIVDTGRSRAPTVDAVIGRGNVVRDVRNWKETLLNSTNQNPICYSIGLVANSMLEIVESCSLGLEFKNSQNILFFSRLFSDFSSFLKNNAELLIKNEGKVFISDIINRTADIPFGQRTQHHLENP